jgi:hypothetical protein
LRLLTDDSANQAVLKTSLGTLTRVLEAVDWSKISKGSTDAWPQASDAEFADGYAQAWCNMSMRKDLEQFSDQETEQRFNKLVRAALNTRPKPLKTMERKGVPAQSKNLAKTPQALLGKLK